VIVKDKKGRPSRISSRRTLRFLKTVCRRRLNSSTRPSPAVMKLLSRLPQPIQLHPKPRAPGGFPRNIIALVLDGQSTEAANLKHVREGIMKYVRERISDGDSVALFSISGGLQLLQDSPRTKQNSSRRLRRLTTAQLLQRLRGPRTFGGHTRNA